METAIFDFRGLTYSNWKATCHVSDQSKVLAMPCWKHSSPTSVLDSSSSCTVKSSVNYVNLLFVTYNFVLSTRNISIKQFTCWDLFVLRWRGASIVGLFKKYLYLNALKRPTITLKACKHTNTLIKPYLYYFLWAEIPNLKRGCFKWRFSGPNWRWITRASCITL